MLDGDPIEDGDWGWEGEERGERKEERGEERGKRGEERGERREERGRDCVTNYTSIIIATQ